MNAGGETADQLVKMTLEGIEVAANIALKAGGSATRSLAAMLYAILTDQKKVKGKTRLNSLLKSGKELKVFAIRNSDLAVFCDEAKKYGVLYSVLKEKNNTDGICDIMVRAEDAAKISRIVDKFELATIDTKAIRSSILAERDNEMKDISVMGEKEHDDLVKSLMDSTTLNDKEKLDIQPNPLNARTNQKSEKVFEPILKGAKTKEDTKPSVRKQLNEFKKELETQSKKPQINKTKEISHKNIKKVKKKKAKVR